MKQDVEQCPLCVEPNYKYHPLQHTLSFFLLSHILNPKYPKISTKNSTPHSHEKQTIKRLTLVTTRRAGLYKSLWSAYALLLFSYTFAFKLNTKSRIASLHEK